MPKYHVNPETGNPGICRAKKQCRFGGDEAHYETLADAFKGYEERIAPLVHAFDSAQATYNNKKAILDATIAEAKQLRKDHRDGKPIDFDRLAELEQLQRDQTNDFRKAYYAYKIASNALRNENILEYDDQADTPPRTSEAKGSQIRFDKGTAKTDELVVDQLSAWSGKSRASIQELIDSYNGAEGEERDRFIVRQFQEGESPERIAYVDLETSGYSPTTGEIIEIGIVVTDKDGTIIQTVDERFDLEDPVVRDLVGTGPVDVHKINPEDIAGKRRYTDADVQREMGEILNDRKTVLVAHQAGFEKRWLNHYQDGFQDARDKESAYNLRNGLDPAPIQDTKIISEMLLHTTTDNKLGSFAEANGVAYEDAHSAFPDALMTKNALDNFRANLRKAPPGERPTL